MNAWLHAHAEALGLTLRQFGRQPAGSVLSIVVIAVGLLFPVGGYLLVTNARAIAAGAGTGAQISIFLAAEAGPEERSGIERRLRSETAVKTFRFIGRDEALRELESRTGSGNLLDGLAANPLPDTFLVAPKDPTPGIQERLAVAARAWPGVAEVQVDAAWAERLRSLVAAAEMLLMGVGLLLGFAVLAIAFNTIRLQVLTRSEEIAVLALFGATPTQIRRPFLYFGWLQGSAAAVAAWGIVEAGLRWVQTAVGPLLSAYGLPGRLTGLGWQDGVTLVAFSGLVGALGAWLAVRAHGRSSLS